MTTDSLDTGVILTFILGYPEEQVPIISKLLATEDTRHYIQNLAICECVFLLEQHYKYTPQAAAGVMQSFLESFDDVLEYDRELFQLVFPFYAKHPTLSFNECCMAFAAELDGAKPLLTFDAKLARTCSGAKKLVV
ncbi:hypothetical protein IJ135_01085 [Candidatus Saccharibacteria bacterium]|nr:hypothetical protein [Candidatus Saccharibacteria bacterium]